MKSVLFLSMLLVSSSVLATPAVGDKILVKKQIVGPEGPVDEALETIEIIEFDAENNRFMERTSLQMDNGLVGVNELWSSAGDYPTSQHIQKKIANCAADGGTVEVVEMQGQKIQTCRTQISEGTEVWIADVLHGALKVVQQMGDGYSEQLTVLRFVNK